MKLSELFEKGMELSTGQHMIFIESGDEGHCIACALGTLVIGHFGDARKAEVAWIRAQFSGDYPGYQAWMRHQIDTLNREVVHPVTSVPGRLCEILENLFEEWDWSREQILALLQENGL